MKTILLNTGATMPVNGIGTFLMRSHEAHLAIYTALKADVRLIDCANVYLNERAVGVAIQESHIDRSEIFLVSKLWPTVYNHKEAIDETLERLDTPYLDLLLLHQPCGDIYTGYRLMEKAYREGKVKALGLSNFSIDQIEEVLSYASIKPSVVQVEAHPYYPQDDLQNYLHAHQMVMMAWYPLAHGNAQLLSEKIFQQLSLKYRKTPAQIILRWGIQKGHIVIPGSKNTLHIDEDIQLFDFNLTDEEMTAISHLARRQPIYCPSEHLVSKYATMSIDLNAQA